MMTGNMLKATTAFASNSDIWVPASFVLSYMVGAIIFNQLQDWTRSKLRDPDEDDEENVLAPMRYVAPLVAVLFLGANLLEAGRAAQKALQVPLLAMGFGVVNCAAAQATGNTIFFAMTGNLTKITNYLCQFAKQRVWDSDAATVTSLKILRGFLGGAVATAVILRYGNVLPHIFSILGLLYASLFAWYTYTPSMMATTIHNLQQTFRFSVSSGLQRLGSTVSKRGRVAPSEKSHVQLQSLIELLPTTRTQDLLCPTGITHPGNQTGHFQIS